jgi:hypothetical protein
MGNATGNAYAPLPERLTAETVRSLALQLPPVCRERLARELLAGLNSDGVVPGAVFYPPDAFSWAGRRVDNLSPTQYRLMQALTDRDRLRDFVPFAEVAAIVYRGRPQPGDLAAAFKELARRTEEKFHTAQPRVQLFFDRKRYRIRLRPFGQGGIAGK